MLAVLSAQAMDESKEIKIHAEQASQELLVRAHKQHIAHLVAEQSKLLALLKQQERRPDELDALKYTYVTNGQCPYEAQLLRKLNQLRKTLFVKKPILLLLFDSCNKEARILYKEGFTRHRNELTTICLPSPTSFFKHDKNHPKPLFKTIDEAQNFTLFTLCHEFGHEYNEVGHEYVRNSHKPHFIETKKQAVQFLGLALPIAYYAGNMLRPQVAAHLPESYGMQYLSYPVAYYVSLALGNACMHAYQKTVAKLFNHESVFAPIKYDVHQLLSKEQKQQVEKLPKSYKPSEAGECAQDHLEECSFQRLREIAADKFALDQLLQENPDAVASNLISEMTRALEDNDDALMHPAPEIRAKLLLQALAKKEISADKLACSPAIKKHFDEVHAQFKEKFLK